MSKVRSLLSEKRRQQLIRANRKHYAKIKGTKEHTEARKARCKAWYQKNKQRVLVYQKQHREKIKEDRRAWTDKNRQKIRDKHRSKYYLYTYGMTVEQIDTMYAAQQGRCGICEEAIPRKKIHLDHCHKSRNVRGILCCRCNMAIGLLRDDPTLLKKAIEYLTKARK